jgi:hypothetical protein
MSTLKFGFILGLIGGVTGVLNLANDIPYLKALASPGWFVAKIFGKACVGAFQGACSAKEVPTTIVAVSVGNGIVYAIAGALLGWGFKAIFSSKSSPSTDENQKSSEQKTIIEIVQKQSRENKEDKRSQSKAIVSSKINKK